MVEKVGVGVFGIDWCPGGDSVSVPKLKVPIERDKR